MNGFGTATAALAAFLMTGGAGFAAPLFHNGGLGECYGCHGKSAVQNVQPAFSVSSTSSITMLKGSDPGSVCLTCHEAPKGTLRPEGHYIATSSLDMPAGTPPVQLTPGGDFGWLKKSYPASDGTGHGHNILAADFNYEETDSTTAPGGKYPAKRLTCISCHDPHGAYRRWADGTITSSGLSIVASGSYSDSPDPGPNGPVGSYRLLAGKGYQPKYLVNGDYAFRTDPPAAVAPPSYNRAESSADTRVAYGSGMSEWCKNCHVIPHGDSVGHPAGNEVRLTGEAATNYDSYIVAGNLKGTTKASYSSLVPFEIGTNDYALLKAAANSDGSNRTGPTGRSNVMCLTCHRAHASGWDFMTRWDMRTKHLVLDGRYPGSDGDYKAIGPGGRTTAEIQRAYYERGAGVFGQNQKSLCNKCHPKD